MRTVAYLLLPIVFSVVLLFNSGASRAADIYINSEKVRGLTNLTLENCTITFNAKGDIYISAPEFKVLQAAAKGKLAETTSPPKDSAVYLKNRYFLFTQSTSPGDVPFRFEVLVNGKSVKEIFAVEEQLTQELTLFLKRGKNEIRIKSFYEAERRGSEADSFSILIGRGAPNHGSLEINKLLLNYSRKGSDSGDASDVFTIQAE
jgi:hypothetical protein